MCKVWPKLSHSLAPSSHLCCHEGECVHAMRSSQEAADHSQATTVQKQGDQQTEHTHMAVHRCGWGERQLWGGETKVNEYAVLLNFFFLCPKISFQCLCRLKIISSGWPLNPTAIHFVKLCYQKDPAIN